MSSTFSINSGSTVPGRRTTQPLRVDTFTLTFKRGGEAVLNVYGAPNYLEALSVALRALVNCTYTVADGDRTHGQAKTFYAWWHQPQDSQEVQA